jgi:hypothetical protein
MPVMKTPGVYKSCRKKARKPGARLKGKLMPSGACGQPTEEPKQQLAEKATPNRLVLLYHVGKVIVG